MKTRYKSIPKIALGCLGCMFLTVSTYAQRAGASGGGSVSASSSSSSNSAPSPSPSPSPAVSYSRPTPSVSYTQPVSSYNSSSRPDYQRSSQVPQSNNGVRSSYGFTQRQGVSVNQSNSNYQQRAGVAAYPGNNNRQGVAAYSGNNNRPGVSAYSGSVSSYTPRQSASGYNTYNNNGVTAYSQRAGVTASGFRSNGNIRGDYWGNHDYYHYNRGYYATYYQPRLGFSCYALPYGYYPFYWGDYQYYYSDGLFYQYTNDQYTVVEPPIGAEVTTLPSNAQSIVINGQQYYEAGGVYYQPYTKDDGTVVYVVAGKDGELNTSAVAANEQPRAPQIGDLVSQLPSNCRKVFVNGQKLFVSIEGVYFQEKVDENAVKYYKIVGLPSDDPDQN